MSNAAASGSSFRLAIRVTSGADVTDVAQRNRRAMYEAYQSLEKGDQSTFVSLFNPDVTLYEAESLPYGGTAQGFNAAFASFATVLSAWSRCHVTIEEITAGGDLVIVYMKFSGTAAATGKDYEGPCCEVFRFVDGKVVEWRPVYWDTHAARNALLA